MSKRKGALEDVDHFLDTEKKSFKIDTRKEKVFFKGRWIDAEEDKEVLLQILKDKQEEMRDLKNAFMQDFQKDDEDVKKTRDIAKKIGELATEISELEDILNVR